MHRYPRGRRTAKMEVAGPPASPPDRTPGRRDNRCEARLNARRPWRQVHENPASSPSDGVRELRDPRVEDLCVGASAQRDPLDEEGPKLMGLLCLRDGLHLVRVNANHLLVFDDDDLAVVLFDGLGLIREVVLELAGLRSWLERATGRSRPPCCESRRRMMTAAGKWYRHLTWH